MVERRLNYTVEEINDILEKADTMEIPSGDTILIEKIYIHHPTMYSIRRE